MSTTYSVTGASLPGGEGTIEVFGETLRFDAGAERDLVRPGPAELLCASLAACLLKNVERFSGILPFRYTSAQVWVEADRDDSPPRFVRFRYRVEVVTDEPAQRVELLHRNVRQFGTVSGTLALAVPVEGTLTAVRHGPHTESP